LDGAFLNPCKAFASSGDLDSALVLKHCLAADRRALRLCLSALGLLLLGLLCVLALHSGAAQLLSTVAIFALMLGSDYDLRRGSKAKRLLDPVNDRDIALFPTTALQAEVLASVSRGEVSPVVIFSGFRPFVGAGIPLDAWNLTVNTKAPRTTLGTASPPIPFHTAELHDYVAKRLNGMGIRGLAMHDRIYVSGRDIHGDARFLPAPGDRPSTTIDLATIGELEDTNSEFARHYRRYQVTSWQGDISVSYFVRFTRFGDYLAVEVSSAILTPIKEAYNLEGGRLRGGSWPRLLARALAWTVFASIAFPFVVLARLNGVAEGWRARRRVRGQAAGDSSFDYGATSTIRELAAQLEYRRYFQLLDRQAYKSVLEKGLLEALVEFLEQHHVDTSELKERQSVVLNNGIMMSGGSLQADSLAVGQDSTVSTIRAAGTRMMNKIAPKSDRAAA